MVAESKAKAKSAKGRAESKPATVAAGAAPGEMPPELLAKVAAIRSSVRENFGKVAMALMMLPRYRAQTIGDLQHLVLEPLLRDRLAIAFPGANDGEASLDREMLGFAIWASVSEEVDLRIREQIRAGVFPVRLKPEDWQSGSINWLLDVIAPTQAAVVSVIANFRQLAKEGSLSLHPVITRLVDAETLQKMGAEKSEQAPAARTVN